MVDIESFKKLDKEKKKYITLRLDEDAAEMIRNAAKNAKTTQSNVIRFLFKKYKECKEKDS